MLKLNEVSEIIMGQSPSSATYNTAGEGLPFFQGNADFGDEHPNVRMFCSIPIKIAEVNDVLLSVRAPIGAVNVADKKCCIGRGLAAIRPQKGKSITRYLFHLLIANRGSLENKGTGSTFKAITGKVLNSVKVPHENVDEQKAIADILDKIVATIRKRRVQVSLCDDLVKSQFIEMFGNPQTNEKGYPLLTVDDVIEFQGGSQPDKSYFEYTKTDNNVRLIQIRDYKTDKFVTYIPKNMVKRYCYADDIMIGRYGPPIFQILQGIEGSYNVALMKAIPKKGNKEFIRQFLKQDCLLHYLEGLSKRTAGQDGIQMDKLKQYPFPYPPIELQEQFAHFAEQTDKSKFRIKQSLEKLETLYKALLQKYFG